MRLLPYFAAIVVVIASSPVFANPALEGYSNEFEFAARIRKLDESDFARVSVLTKTAGSREMQLITLGRGEPGKKPAIAIIGGVRASRLGSSELALRTAEAIITRSEEPAIKKMLEETTIYLIPQADPDAAARNFLAPFREIDGNGRPSDDDRDGRFGEDPAEDLNGDGWITHMRVADESGRWNVHPDDPRVLYEIDPRKGERGKYALYTEGIDNDRDGKFNEDSGDGTAFHRNWTHRYEPFSLGAGPQPVSENTSRAIADFLYDHPEIFAVFSLGDDDNVFHPWKPDGKDRKKIPTAVAAADAAYLELLAGKFREGVEVKDHPPAAPGAGAFSEWSYFQFGRWTFSLAPLPLKTHDASEPKLKESRGADDVLSLRALDQRGEAAFAAWEKITHPDFPDREVEVGGFKPFFRTNPPLRDFESITERCVKALTITAESRPRLEIIDANAEALGGNVFRVTAKIVNRGTLPSVSEMGEIAAVHQHVQVQLLTPEKTTFVQGSPRVKLSRLEATASKEIHWLVRVAGEGELRGKLRLWSPEIDERSIEWKWR